MNDTTFEQGHNSLRSPDPNDQEMRTLRHVKQENKELGLTQQDLIRMHADLTEKLARMKDNLQKMKYAECMESKVNMTTNQLNR